MRALKSASTTALLIAVVTIVPQATAQYPGGGGAWPPGAGGIGGGQAQRASNARARPAADAGLNRGAPVLVQLDQLESDLKLAPEQRALWDAYADKILHLADEMTRSQFAARVSPPPTQATAAQQFDQLADSERNRLTEVEQIVAAGKALYAMLTSEQRTIADRRLLLPMRPLTTGVALPGSGEAGHRSATSP